MQYSPSSASPPLMMRKPVRIFVLCPVSAIGSRVFVSGEIKNPSLSDTPLHHRLVFLFSVSGLCSTSSTACCYLHGQKAIRTHSILLCITRRFLSFLYSYSPSCHRYPSHSLHILGLSRMVSHSHSLFLTYLSPHVHTPHMAGAVRFLIIASCVSSLHERYTLGCPHLVVNTLYSMTVPSNFLLCVEILLVTLRNRSSMTRVLARALLLVEPFQTQMLPRTNQEASYDATRSSVAQVSCSRRLSPLRPCTIIALVRVTAQPRVSAAQPYLRHTHPPTPPPADSGETSPRNRA